MNKITSLFSQSVEEPIIVKDPQDKIISNSTMLKGRYVVIIGKGENQQMGFTIDKKFASPAKTVLQFVKSHMLTQEQVNILKRIDYESNTTPKSKITTDLKFNIGSLLEKVKNAGSMIKQIFCPKIDIKGELRTEIQHQEQALASSKIQNQEQALASSKIQHQEQALASPEKSKIEVKSSENGVKLNTYIESKTEEIKNSILENHQDQKIAIESKKQELIENINQKLKKSGLQDEINNLMKLEAGDLIEKQKIYDSIYSSGKKELVKDILEELSISDSDIENMAKESICENESFFSVLRDINMNMIRLQGLAIDAKKEELINSVNQKLKESGLKDKIGKQNMHQSIFKDETLKKATKDIISIILPSNDDSDIEYEAKKLLRKDEGFLPTLRKLSNINESFKDLEAESIKKLEKEEGMRIYKELSKNFDEKVAHSKLNSKLKDEILNVISLNKEIKDMEGDKEKFSKKQILDKKDELEKLQKSIIENEDFIKDETLRGELEVLLKEVSIPEESPFSLQARVIKSILKFNPSVRVVASLAENIADQVCQTSVKNIKEKLEKEELMKKLEAIISLRTEIQKTIESCPFSEDKEKRKKVEQEIERKQIEIEDIKKQLVADEKSKKILLNIKKEWEISENSSFIEEKAKAKMLEDPLLKEIDGLNLKKSGKRVNFNEMATLSTEIVVSDGTDKKRINKINTQIRTNLNDRSEVKKDILSIVENWKNQR